MEAVASDLNDSDILGQTTKSAAGNKHVLSYTLPSGRTVQSPPLDADDIPSYVRSWLTGVREQYAADLAATESQRREERVKEVRQMYRDNPELDPYDDPEEAPAKTFTATPSDLIRAQLEAAEEALERSRNEFQLAESRMTEDMTKVTQWRAALAALEDK